MQESTKTAAATEQAIDRDGIANALLAYAAQKDITDSRLATLLGVSPATVSSNIRKPENREKIANAKWQGFALWLAQNTTASATNNARWKVVDTSNVATIRHIRDLAAENKQLYCVVGSTGWGKTTALKQLGGESGSYYVLCDTLHTNRSLLIDIARSMGVPTVGTKRTLMESIVDAASINKGLSAVLLLDDVGKLPQECYRTIQLLYDKLEGIAGIVLAGTDKLRSILDEGAKYNRVAFPELVRRIRNKEWRLLTPPTPADVSGIANLYGITDTRAVKYLTTNCKEYQWLRDVILDALQLSSNDSSAITLDTVSRAANPFQ